MQFGRVHNGGGGGDESGVGVKDPKRRACGCGGSSSE